MKKLMLIKYEFDRCKLECTCCTNNDHTEMKSNDLAKLKLINFECHIVTPNQIFCLIYICICCISEFIPDCVSTSNPRPKQGKGEEELF